MNASTPSPSLSNQEQLNIVTDSFAFIIFLLWVGAAICFMAFRCWKRRHSPTDPMSSYVSVGQLETGVANELMKEAEVVEESSSSDVLL
jgi:hypothetical protein